MIQTMKFVVMNEVNSMADKELFGISEQLDATEQQKSTEQPSAIDTNVATTDSISRAAVVDAIDGVDWYHQNQHGEMVHGANPDEHQAWYKADDIYAAIERVPSAQPNLSEAYSKAVFTWLTDYQIRAEKLRGRYAPYEVLSWVINDWRKENDSHRGNVVH